MKTTKGENVVKCKIIKASVIIFCMSLFVFAEKADDENRTLDSVFIKSLENGLPYCGSFVYPFTEDTLCRTIVGLKKGICVYIEEMPDSGKMICNYKEKDLKKMAMYYRLISKAAPSSVNVKLFTGVTPDGQPTFITNKVYMLDGKQIENPLAECFQNGDCKIEGYYARDSVKTASKIKIETTPVENNKSAGE